MKTILILLSVWLLFSASPSAAVEIGDFYYSNKTFDRELVQGLRPIGIVYWVNEDKNSGLIAALEHPGSKNWERAKTYCHLYLTRGTKAGDWHLPNFLELFPIDKMQNRRLDGKAFRNLNQRLNMIKEAKAFKDGIYMSSSDYDHDRRLAIGIDLATGELEKLKKKGRYNFRCMMSF